MSGWRETTTPDEVRTALRLRREIALLDAREEHPYAESHPLFAAQLPLSRLELDAPWRLPRHDVSVVVYDDGDGTAERLARGLAGLGYTNVRRLAGGLQGWRRAGGELFRDVNVPSKAFGELVEHERRTPSMTAPQLKALIDEGANLVVLDARRFDEYRTMSIPHGISVPGAELALRVRDLAPDPSTRVVVNCAGRTRSIIGAQSLVNIGIPNPVAALRNGTIGWTLAGLSLERGQQRCAGPVSSAAAAAARGPARRLAEQAGARRVPLDGVLRAAPAGRTVYRYDVRSPEEYADGHLPGFGNAPGGQLVQETDVYAPVRGARIVLVDDDGVRAPMTAHWLAQMGWDVAWIDGASPADFASRDPWPPRPATPDRQAVPGIAAREAGVRTAEGRALLVDVGTSAQHVARHPAGAWWALRSAFADALERLSLRSSPPIELIVTADDPAVAAFAAAELAPQAGVLLRLLEGGNAAWYAAGLPHQAGEARLASPRIDRYRRPYEGTDNARDAMQAYLDWEYGLVAQLERDGTHGFRVLGVGGAIG